MDGIRTQCREQTLTCITSTFVLGEVIPAIPHVSGAAWMAYVHGVQSKQGSPTGWTATGSTGEA